VLASINIVNTQVVPDLVQLYGELSLPRRRRCKRTCGGLCLN